MTIAYFLVGTSVQGALPPATLAAALTHSAALIPGGRDPYKARRARIFTASASAC